MLLENKKEWTSQDQKNFLTEELVLYKSVSRKEYARQWPALYQKWFQRWPERCSVLAVKDIPTEQPLSDEQSLALAAAIDKRQKVCKFLMLYLYTNSYWVTANTAMDALACRGWEESGCQ
jgi:hypothetical protein